jgi:hypothetical protein
MQITSQPHAPRQIHLHINHKTRHLKPKHRPLRQLLASDHLQSTHQLLKPQLPHSRSQNPYLLNRLLVMESNPHRLYPALGIRFGDLAEFLVGYCIPVLLAAVIARGWEPVRASPGGGVLWCGVAGEVFGCDGDFGCWVTGAEFEGGC